MQSPTFYAYLRAVGEEQENLAEEAKELLHIIEEKGLGERVFLVGIELDSPIYVWDGLLAGCH